MMQKGGRELQKPENDALDPGPYMRVVGAGATAVLAVLVNETLRAGLVLRLRSTFVLSAFALLATMRFVPDMAPLFLKAKRFGKDINKRGTPAGEVPIPESLGLVPATVYLLVLCLLHADDLRQLDGDLGGEARLYTSAMASVTFMVLLGFADDVLDLKWRYKLVLPLLASTPLLVNYSGSTSVLVPVPLRGLVGSVATVFGGGMVGGPSGRLVDIGIAYYIYMAMLSIFCTNAINIYAGINGLEAGQSLVIAAFVLIHNALNFSPPGDKDNLGLLRLHHTFSVDLILPFAAVTLGLLRYNRYPSSVFVGDTFCYFAGMTFAMASILGHYSETLLVFFIPQLVNFVYSLPQLFGIVPCPRHRLPAVEHESGKLVGVPSNLNLVNLVLLCTGPMHERELCALLLLLQVACCSFGLMLRHVVVNVL